MALDGREKIMAGDIRDRLREAILAEDDKVFKSRREAHEAVHAAEDRFRPVAQAAEDIREELASVPSLEFAIIPTSVWITLFDREIRLNYDAASGRFFAEESGHSWYDGETYVEAHSWNTAEECIEAMIRFSATYARMARTIQRAGSRA
jgi:hypothetical protein